MLFTKNKQPENILTFGYLATVLAVGIFAGLAVFVQNRYISVEEKAANAMVLMSRQQFLVQEMALLLSSKNQIKTPSKNFDAENIPILASEIIDKHNTLMAIFNHSEGLLWDLDDTILLDAEEIDSYKELDKTIRHFVNLASTFPQWDEGKYLDHLKQIYEISSKIILTIDQTQQSQLSERKEKTSYYKTIQIFGYLLILFLVLLAGALVFRPISRQIRATRIELERARKQAEKASKIKSDFLTNISHEIRTPLSGILGFADMILCDPNCSSSLRENVFSIQRSAEHLKTLIEDILDLSKVEAGTIVIEKEIFNLMDIIHEVKSIIEVRMKDKGIEFSIFFQTEIPEFIVSDPVRVIQILVNLLSNAIKFTDEGSVKLQISAIKDSAARTELTFTITDTGCGIAANKTKKLFKRFSQVDSSLSRKIGGTGLGLALSKKLASLLGGDLFLLETKLGVGSSFRFILVCEVPKSTRLITSFSETSSAAEDAVDPRDLKGTLEGLRILLVEDGEDNQRVYNYFLKIAGAKVYPCWDGLAGLEFATNNDHYDLVLMDIQLPKMDGYNVTKELRNRGIRKPIIALTAHAMQREREKCLSSGFDDYVSKPVSIPKLIRTIQRHSPIGLNDNRKDDIIRSKYHNQEIYIPMIVEFVGSLSVRVHDLREAIDAKEWSLVMKLAHKIKGAAATYGFPILTEQVSEIELAANSREESEVLERFNLFVESCDKAEEGAKELRKKL